MLAVHVNKERTMASTSTQRRSPTQCGNEGYTSGVGKEDFRVHLRIEGTTNRAGKVKRDAVESGLTRDIVHNRKEKEVLQYQDIRGKTTDVGYS